MSSTNIAIKQNLEKNFGIEDSDLILKYLSRIKNGISEAPNTDIDKLVKVIKNKLPSVEKRYERLITNTDDPATRLKTLYYIIKSITHRLQ